MNSAARRELPELVNDLMTRLNALDRSGPLNDGALMLAEKIGTSMQNIGGLEIGISNALNNLQYEIDDLKDCFWDFDPRQKLFEEMLDLISEFLRNPRYVRKSTKSRQFH